MLKLEIFDILLHGEIFVGKVAVGEISGKGNCCCGNWLLGKLVIGEIVVVEIGCWGNCC